MGRKNQTLHWVLQGYLDDLKKSGASVYLVESVFETFLENEKLKVELNKLKYDQAKTYARLPFALLFNVAPDDVNISGHDCPYSPIGACVYVAHNNEDDSCSYCGDPMERK